MNYQIYRLCRDNERIKKLQREEKKFSLPKTEYVTGVDMYTFINDIILNCKTDYALLCHDDVVLPLTIHENIKKCLESANNYIGQDNWSVIGNAGIEVLTKKVLHYLTDPDIKIIPPYTKHPDLVESVDGNTMLLNIKNLRSKKVLLPKELSGFHLYDIILCLEAQRKGLVCGVSSYLFVTHLSGGNRQAFIDSWNTETFQKYFLNTFSNRVISSLNGEITINHVPKTNKLDIEEKIEENILKVFSKEKYKLNIFSQEIVPSVEKIAKQNPSIKSYTWKNIQELREGLKKDESFSIILRKGDSLSTKFLRYLPYILSNTNLIIGNTKMVSKTENSIEKAQNITNLYTGKRNKPLNLVIYKTTLLKEVLDTILLEESIFNDFEIFFEALKHDTYKIFPILFGERQYDNNNYDITGYPLTTMLSEITNRNSITKNFYNFYRSSTEELERKIHSMGTEYNAYMQLKNTRLWRFISPIRKLHSLLRRK